VCGPRGLGAQEGWSGQILGHRQSVFADATNGLPTENHGSQFVMVLIVQTAGTANLVEWAKLALKDLRAPVLRVVRLRRAENSDPLVLEEVVLPLDPFPDLVANGEVIPDIAELAQRYGLSLGGVTEHIRIVPAPRHIARHLKVAAGTNVVKLERVIETTNGKPVEWRVAYASEDLLRSPRQIGHLPECAQ